MPKSNASNSGSNRLIKFALPAIAISLLFVVSACEQSNQNVSGSVNELQSQSNPVKTEIKPVPKPQVVVSNSVLCDLVKQIAADQVQLSCLIAPGSDPHVYKSTPADLKLLAAADLILYGGYDFEPAIIKAIANNKVKAAQVAVSERAIPKPIMREDHEDQEASGHSHSSKEGNLKEKEVADPHIWNDPKNGKKMTEVVSQELIKILPDQKVTLQQKTTAFTTKLDQIDRWITTQMSTIPTKQRQLVTTHDSLSYFGQAYNLEIKTIFEGISAEQKPSPARIADLIDQVKKSKVPTIFVEININPQLIQMISKEAKVKVAEQELFGDGIGAPGSGADTYTDMLITNTRTIVQGLGGKFTPFESKVSLLP
jgi:manganese/iron transport system substrate-binding protein